MALGRIAAPWLQACGLEPPHIPPLVQFCRDVKDVVITPLLSVWFRRAAAYAVKTATVYYRSERQRIAQAEAHKRAAASQPGGQVRLCTVTQTV